MASAPPLRDPERQLALAYVPAARREALGCLWALDEQFAHLLTSGREPTLALMRMIWWRDSLAALDTAPPPAQPLLRQVAERLLPAGLRGQELASLEEGWSGMLDDAGNEDVASPARRRGEVLFDLSARLLGGEDERVPAGGACWSLVDRARHASTAAERDRLMAAAGSTLAEAGPHGRWPRALRPLAVLVALARADVRAGSPLPQGGPLRLMQALRAGLTGR